LDRVRREVERNALRARNGIKLAAASVGDRRSGVGGSAKRVVWRRGRAELWRYDNDAVVAGVPVLIVFSLISRSYILDLRPGNSFVEHLVKAGFDVYLLDWGVPDERDAQNTLDDYVHDYIPAAIARTRQCSQSRTVNLLGYCLGGNLALLHAAHSPSSPLRSLTVMATPVDFRYVGPLADVFATSSLDVESVLDDCGNVPASIIQRGFRVLTPTADATRYAALWQKLWNDEYVDAYQAMTQWVGDHIPFPGAAAKQTVEMFVRDNGMVNDRLRVGDDAIHLRDIRVPFLTVIANRDHIVRPEAAEALIDLVGSTDKKQLRLDAGHIGLVVGRTAARTTIPHIVDFLRRHGEDVPAGQLQSEELP
jgi:polyhydroxyalkanoate synthase